MSCWPPPLRAALPATAVVAQLRLHDAEQRQLAWQFWRAQTTCR